MKIQPIVSDFTTNQRLSVMRMFSVLMMFGTLMFSAINFYRQIYLFGLMELAIALSSLLFYLTIKKNISTQLAQYMSKIYLAVFAVVYTFIIWFEQSNESAIVFIMLVPLLTYFVLGVRLGAKITFIVTIVIICVLIHKWAPSYGTNQLLLLVINVVTCLIYVWFLVYAYAKEGQNHNQKLIKLAMEDQLTGLYNRSALHTFVSSNADLPFCMVILDIDWFKKINDSYGHDVGDEALRVIAQKLKAEFEHIGYLIRLGGEEFAIILPNTTIEEAYRMTQAFQNNFNQTKVVTDRGDFSMTFSAGIAEFPKEADTFLELQKLADRRLYNAKNNGRNCICRWLEAESSPFAPFSEMAG